MTDRLLIRAYVTSFVCATHTYREEDEETDGDILDEPVHARVRQEKGMVLVVPSSSARASSSEDEDEGMEESSGDD